MYAIIDVETTGGSPSSDRIIEIAIILYDGSTITETYSTLVNPKRNIDPYVTKLTGIDISMVKDAPTFEDIHERVLSLTNEAVFVAHNVKFDFGMIRQEYKRLGIDYNRRQLDTVNLARKVLPGFNSYSLGNICESLGIEITDRHRALGDAEATVKLLERILQKEAAHRYLEIELNHGIDLELLPPYISKAEIEKLPEDAGVYYYKDEVGKVLFLEGTKNIRKKVISNFSSSTVSPETNRMFELMRSIDYELTGNELTAKLIAHRDTKAHLPEFNKKPKTYTYTHGIYLSTDEQGFRQFKIHDLQWAQDELLVRCTSKASANKILARIAKENNLFGWFALRSKLKEKGIEEKQLQKFNTQIDRAARKFLYRHTNFYILANGIHPDQYAVVSIENNTYKGLGYFSPEFLDPTPENLQEVIKPDEDDAEVHKIIRGQMRKMKNLKVVPY